MENESDPQNVEAKAAPTHGFGAMDVETRREYARRGGKTAQATGRAYKFTAEDASRAGKKGGQVVSEDRAHMSEIRATRRHQERATP